MPNQPIKYRDHPIAECKETVEKIRTENPDVTIYQKFTCEKCGERLTMAEPNEFFESGTCEQCGHVTDITKNGCNYLMTFGV